MAELRLDGKMIFAIFIGAIITVVLMSAIANEVTGTTQLQTTQNFSFISPAVNTTVEVSGRNFLTLLEVINSTGHLMGTQMGSNLANYSFNTSTGADGLTAILVTTLERARNQTGDTINASYTYEPDGYQQNAGARSLTVLVMLMSALAIVVTIIVFLWKGSLSTILKRTG